MNANRVLLYVFLLAAAPLPLKAQLEVGGDMMDQCARIDALRKGGDLAAARNAAQQCLKGIEQELEGQVSKFFLPEVAGWMRTSLEQNQAMGISNISATYEKGDVSVDVSLTGGGGASGLEGAFGGVLGGIARMGMQQSGRQVRVGGLPATVQSDGTVAVSLESGSFLTFMSSQFHDQDAALKGMGDLINAFPVADINKATK